MRKENLIKLLQAMSDSSYNVHNIFHDDRKWKMSAAYLAESAAYDTVIYLLTKPDFAEEMWKTFFPGEEAPAV